MMSSDPGTPRVSVILPVYNEEEFLQRSVDSMLRQTYEDFELILLDDGSTDSSWQLIQEIDDPRVRGVRLSRVGFTKALNHGLRIARGEFIARMDADDESLPQRFQRQVEFLDAHPDVSVVGTAYYKHDALRDESYIRVHPETDQEIRRGMASYIPICHGSVMFRKSAVQEIGGYSEDVRDIEDLELWLRAAPHVRFANLGLPPLYVYWFDPGNSFFESSYGRHKRVWKSLCLHARAIRVLRLPAYNYAWLAAKCLYYFALPNGVKKLARRMFSKSSEIQVRREARAAATSPAQL